MIDLLAALTTAVWAAGFSLLGRLAPTEAARWRSPGGQRVVVVAPHPDDEIIGCAGTILRHRHAGDAVMLLIVSDGRGSRAGGLGPEAMAAQRQREAQVAAERLGVTLTWLGLPEGAWPEDAFPDCRSFLHTADIVYAPSTVDFHPEHLQVAHALAHQLPDGVTVRVYPVHTPLTVVLTNLIAPIDDVAGDARVAAQAYGSQADSVDRSWRRRRYTARRYRLPGLAEAFWEMDAADYRRLHAEPPGHWSLQPYRGMWARPWRDPLAYMAGRAARRRLLQGVKAD